MATCIILTSSDLCCGKHEKLLRSLFDEKPDLFLAHGIDAESWEVAMEMCCVMLDVNGVDVGVFCNTTAHCDEVSESVLRFAEEWCDLKGTPRDIKVIYV